MDFLFDSANPYQSLQAMTENSPEELVAALKKIQTPIKIVAIVQVGARSVAYVMGDLRIEKPKTTKKQGAK